jgi:uncharacterized membrane protein
MLGRLKNFIAKHLVTLIVFALVYFYLFYIFKPSLIFLDTTISGGDTGSHNYIFYYLKKNFPSILTWSHDWYYGFPFLHFYPPLLYILAVLLSYLIPGNIAFKIVTLLGTFSLPLTSYLALKIINREIKSEIMAVISLFFLFLEQYSIYGGNIPSTLAGEFSYSFSFSLFWLFIALMKKGIEENRYLFLNTLLLSLIVLSHPIPAIVSIFSMFFFLFLNPQSFSYIAMVYILAFNFTIWWSLPFLLFFAYTSPMKWTMFIRFSDIFPTILIPLQLVALICVIWTIYSYVKRNKRVKEEILRFAQNDKGEECHPERSEGSLASARDVMLFLFIGMISLFFYLNLNQSKIWNTRFLPFFTMSSLFISAYFLAVILRRINFSSFFMILIAVSSILFINSRLTYIPSWVKWNYEGFERKATWNELKVLFEFLKGLPYGRVMWEYTPQYDRFGTPRVLELIPLFTGKPTVEGLLIESSLSAPFHFIIQSETTLTPTAPNFGFEYPCFRLNIQKAVEHMRFMGIKYFVAYTEEVKREADRVLPIITQIGGFTVYEIPEVRLVEPLFDFQVQRKTKNWKREAVEWFLRGDLSKPIIFAEEVFKKPERKDVKCQLIRFEQDKIEFYTDGIGIPHIVKVSYFPRWRVEGGRGPYLVSPSFMVVIPEKEVVRLVWK